MINFKKIMVISFFTPLCFLIYFLRPLIFIRFGIVQSSRIGALATQIDNHLNANELSNNFLDIITFEEIICNKQLANLISRLSSKNMKIVYFPKFIQRILTTLNFWSSNNIHYIKLVTHPKDFLLVNKTRVNFSKSEKDLIKNFLNNIGIKKNNSWVCVHNRDPLYLNDQTKNSNFKGSFQLDNWNYHNYRDFNINSMISTCNYFLSKNYFVVRVGKKSNEKLDIQHPNFIDYPFIKNQKELLELYLLANCKLFIGSTSGPSSVAHMHKRSLLITNYTELGLLNLMRHNSQLITLKLFFDQKTNTILSLDEIFIRKLDIIGVSQDLKKLNIKLINNSPDEILNASKELEEIDNNTWIETPFRKKLQDKFWSKINQYKEKNRFNKHNLCVSPYFLEKHQNVLF